MKPQQTFPLQKERLAFSYYTSKVKNSFDPGRIAPRRWMYWVFIMVATTASGLDTMAGVEANVDFKAPPQELWPATTVSGSLAVGETTSYVFTGQASQTAHIDMVKISETSGNFWPEIRLYRPDGTFMDLTSGVNRARTDFTLDQEGLWTAIATTNIVGSGTYNISLLLIPGPLSSPQDTDGGVIYSGETQAGVIEPLGDTDAFSFYGLTSQTAHIEMVKISETSGNFWPEIRLYRPDGTFMDLTSGVNRARTDFTLDQEGLWTAIATTNNVGSGTYNISLLLIPGPLSSPQDPDGGVIYSGETQAGVIEPLGDTDAFSFYGLTSQTAHIEMVKISETSGNFWPEIRLYRPDGTFMDLTSGVNRALADFTLDQEGLWTIIATTVNEGSGAYNISVSFAVPPSFEGITGLFPPNGAQVQDASGSFSWDPIAGVLGYDIFFGTDLPLDCIGENIAATSFPFPDFTSEQVYYWRVIAHLPGQSVMGPYLWFRFFEPAHPADINKDFRIELDEAIAYLAGWQQGSNPMNYAIRAAYIWQNGELYQYDENSTPPLCWVQTTK